MKEKLFNLWDDPGEPHIKCVTTNGYVKNNGNAVMGAGVAAQAKVRYPQLPAILGEKLSKDGNHVWPLLDLADQTSVIFSFPVKYKWYETADLDLIKQSAEELVILTDIYEAGIVLLPLPGCGNGRLTWTEVKPHLDPILDDRFWLISNGLRSDFNINTE